MTSAPRFDGTINLGHTLVILTLIVSAVAAWMANRERTLNNAAAISEMSADVENLEVRVRALEITAGKLAGIGEDIHELRSDLRRLISQHTIQGQPQ